MLSSLLSLVTALSLASAPLPATPQTACVRAGLSANAQSYSGVSNDAVAAQVTAQLQQRGWTIYPFTTGATAGDWQCAGHFIISVLAYAITVDNDAYAYTLVIRGYQMADFRGENRFGWAEAYSQLGVFATPLRPGVGDNTLAGQLTTYTTDLATSIE